MTIKLKGDWASRSIWLDGKQLFPDKSLTVANHSPDGFAWSYGGSGPSQLALAICLEIFPDRQEALSKYQNFKWNHIAVLPSTDFERDIVI